MINKACQETAAATGGSAWRMTLQDCWMTKMNNAYVNRGGGLVGDRVFFGFFRLVRVFLFLFHCGQREKDTTEEQLDAKGTEYGGMTLMGEMNTTIGMNKLCSLTIMGWDHCVF